MSERIDPEKLGFTLWKGEHYCKGGIKTGKPLIETDFITGEIIEKDEWQFLVYEKDGTPLIFECRFNNTTGKVKKSGAKAMLKIWKLIKKLKALHDQ